MNPSVLFSSTLITITEISLLAAISEQIIFQGEQSTLTTFSSALTAILLLQAVFSVVVHKRKFFGKFKVSWLFAPCALLFCFALLAERDLNRLLTLGDESGVSLGIFNIAAALLSLLLIGPIFGSFAHRNSLNKLFAGIRPPTIATVILIALIFGIIGGLLFVRFSTKIILPLEYHPSMLGILFILLVLVSGTRTILKSWQPAHGVISTAILSVFMLLITFGFFTLNKSTCNDEPVRYPLNASLLVTLFSTEDPLFLQHRGVDWERLRKAVRETITKGTLKRGGSTLTMQLAKVCYLNPQKTVLRKVEQIITALLLEWKFSKSELLLQYLENVPFAPNITGLFSASAHFYAVQPVDLTSAQELILVQTIFDPSDFNPHARQVSHTVALRAAVIKGLGRRYCQKLVSSLVAKPDIEVVSKKCP